MMSSSSAIDVEASKDRSSKFRLLRELANQIYFKIKIDPEGV